MSTGARLSFSDLDVSKEEALDLEAKLDQMSLERTVRVSATIVCDWHC
jgi:hypothetical protein